MLVILSFISYFCLKINVFMKKLVPHAGLILIATGTVALMLTRLEQLSASNLLLGSGLLLIVAGILLHVWTIKRENKY